jgi:hypothetical protein
VHCRFFKAADQTKFFCDLLDEIATLVASILTTTSCGCTYIFRRSMRTKAGKLIKGWDGLLDRIIDDHEVGNLVQQQEEPDHLIGALLAHQQEYNLPNDHMRALIIVSKIVTILSTCLQ